MNPAIPAIDTIRAYLTGLQDRICADIAAADGSATFHEDHWQRAEGGGGRTRILRDGAVFEQAGIGFSDVSGNTLPPSASVARPELAGTSWRSGGGVAGLPSTQSVSAHHPRQCAIFAPCAAMTRWRGGLVAALI